MQCQLCSGYTAVGFKMSSTHDMSAILLRGCMGGNARGASKLFFFLLAFRFPFWSVRFGTGCSSIFGTGSSAAVVPGIMDRSPSGSKSEFCKLTGERINSFTSSFSLFSWNFFEDFPGVFFSLGRSSDILRWSSSSPWADEAPGDIGLTATRSNDSSDGEFWRDGCASLCCSFLSSFKEQFPSIVVLSVCLVPGWLPLFVPSSASAW